MSGSNNKSKFEVVGNLSSVWTCKKWEDVVGQKQAKSALKGMLRSKKLKQVFLFEGDYGTGKTTSARLLAATVNCDEPIDGIEPCGKCQSCKLLLKNNPPKHPDYLEVDCASNNGIDDVRRLQDFCNWKPKHNVRFICLDEAHKLTKPAQTALFKLLQKPPAHVIICLCTTDKAGLDKAILSRCYSLHYSTPTTNENVELLQRVSKSLGFELSEKPLAVIANNAQNHTRNCLEILGYVVDQMTSDKSASKRLKADEVEYVSEMLGVPQWQIVDRFCKAILRGKRVEMIECLQAAPNKVTFIQMSQEFLARTLYALLSEKLVANAFARKIASAAISEAKLNKDHVPMLTKLVSDLAEVNAKTSAYTIDVEYAYAGVLLKHANAFAEARSG